MMPAFQASNIIRGFHFYTKIPCRKNKSGLIIIEPVI